MRRREIALLTLVAILMLPGIYYASFLAFSALVPPTSLSQSAYIRWTGARVVNFVAGFVAWVSTPAAVVVGAISWRFMGGRARAVMLVLGGIGIVGTGLAIFVLTAI